MRLPEYVKHLIDTAKAQPFGTDEFLFDGEIHGLTYGIDEDGEEYMLIGLTLADLPNVCVEIEDGTYGHLQGIRAYL